MRGFGLAVAGGLIGGLVASAVSILIASAVSMHNLAGAVDAFGDAMSSYEQRVDAARRYAETHDWEGRTLAGRE